MKSTNKLRSQSKHKDLERKKQTAKPTKNFKKRNAEMFEELGGDFDDFMEDGFHGYDDDYYYDDEDNY